jgi:hypothetical protein
MAATITRFTAAPAFQATNVSYIKDIMTSLGIATSAIVYETTTEAIYKITNGAGTYADTYLRFIAGTFALTGHGNGSGWNVQVGTGFANNAITGAGTAAPVMNTTTNSSNSYFAEYFTTVVSADGSYRQLMHFSGNYSYRGGFAIVRPTNTTLTANNAPLTYIAVSAGGNQTWSHYYARSASNAQYGSNTAASSLAVSGSITSSYSFTYLPNQYSLNVAKAGTYGVLPNVPILSGGWPIGYNTNLAFVSASFLPMDRVIVTAGSEEYMVVDQGTGLAVREV